MRGKQQEEQRDSAIRAAAGETGNRLGHTLDGPRMEGGNALVRVHKQYVATQTHAQVRGLGIS